MRFILSAVLTLCFVSVSSAAPPNIVLIFADDLGYADVGSFGAKLWKTPNLDRLAKEGIRFTDFYASQPVCSASRCSLLTGCYANRLGIHGALGPGARHGINANETTIAEMLRTKGYATGMVGKWHLGHHPSFLPTRHGFDSYFGLPYSNDMWPHHPEAKKGTYPNLPLFENEKIIDSDVSADDQCRLTERYRDRAVEFIKANSKKPFFLYFAHTFPHVPLFRGKAFEGSSGAGGIYGDVIQEFDSAIGDILKTLKSTGVEDNTLVIFTSDNGPWLSYGNHGGRKEPLREGKGSVWDGGVRVPMIARWPGKIPEGSVQTEPAMTIDILPTLAEIAGAEKPALPIDGKNILDLLTAKPNTKSPQEAYFFYYGQNQLQAVRSGKWKLILPHNCRMIEDRMPGKDGKPAGYRQVKLPMMLYNLADDIGETINLLEREPEVVKEMLKHVERARTELGDSLCQRKGTGIRQAGQLAPNSKNPISSELIFPLNTRHNHAPGIVECPNGDFLVSWYRGSGERSADDVAVLGSRLKNGDADWSEPFLLADTPGFPDCNTTMFIDNRSRLWLFWPVIIANSWESCLTQYRRAEDYQGHGAPQWNWQGSLFLKPVDFETTMLREFDLWKKSIGPLIPAKLGDDYVRSKVSDKLLSRMGWQPRCKPTILKSGRILLPLYSDTYSAGLMAISDDQVKTWTASRPLAGFGSIQPAVLERSDGSLIAYMRENGITKKIRYSESRDSGMTWSTVGSLDLPNPGSGLDAVRLSNGHFVLIYNDTIKGRNSLAVSLSDDEGKTWNWTRHLENHDTGSFHYPALIQSRDGRLHAVYSYFVASGKSMKHVSFTEDWIR